MKHYLIIIFFGLCSITAHAQQQVVATSGSEMQNISGTISWTIGEPVVTTYQTPNSVVNQGFQQGNVTPNTKAADCTVEMEVWPNPTSNSVTLRAENTENLSCQLFDMQGKCLKSLLLDGRTKSIDLSSFTFGIYLLKISLNGNEVKIFTIVKQ